MDMAAATKIGYVRELFEQPARYLSRWRYNIRIRAETVREFVKGLKYESILDVGCGDGSISVPLLASRVRLTLLDIASHMLTIARSRVPAEWLPNVSMINEDLLTAKLEANAYDLILCVGVLAHVDSPSLVAAKIASLVKPGGTVIVQSTDTTHVVTYLVRLCHLLVGLVRPRPYSGNLLSTEDVVQMFAKHGLRLEAVYRYSLLLPGTGGVFTHDRLYAMVRALFGRYPQARNPWLGNECLYKFRATTLVH
jgi:2-polyprenyl-3-methyl-5-hydroxy-6-metoxy-1,4-benzoquinol methylase